MPMRIPGMASGMDTDAMVKQMMQPYKLRVDKVMQDRDVIKFKQDMYRDMINDVKGFYDKYLTTGSKDYIMSGSTFSGCDAISSDSSVATATGTVGAITGNYKLNVKSLAEAARVSSGSAVMQKDGITQATLGTKMSELSGWVAGSTSADFTITYGGKDYKITASDTDTMDDLMSKANSALSPNVKAYFSELTGKVTFETKQTGASSSVQASGLSFLGIADGSAAGKDAEVAITAPDGTVANVKKPDNSFTIDGINFNIAKVGTADISMKPNVQGSVDKIKAFIGDYNKFIEKINSKIEEKKQYDYRPLTDDQKKDMKDEEIKKWEDKAKEGLLKNDNELSNLVTNLRRAFFDPVAPGGTAIQPCLQQIGLNTSPDTTKRGQIVIDEDKLKKALEENGNEVSKLFNNASSSTDKTTKYQESGVCQRMKDILYENVGKFDGILLKKAGIENSLTSLKNEYSDKIAEKDKIIKQMLSSLATRENSFYSRFAALEKAMNNMNAQSNWLASQLGGGK